MPPQSNGAPSVWVGIIALVAILAVTFLFDVDLYFALNDIAGLTFTIVVVLVLLYALFSYVADW